MACCLTDTGSLRFLLDGEGINVNQTPSTLSLAGFTDSQNLPVDSFLPQGRAHMAHRQRLPGPTVLHKTTTVTAATARATAEEGTQQQRWPQLRQRQ